MDVDHAAPRVLRARLWLLRLLLALLALNAGLALARGAARAVGTSGGIDFHSYWYAGHFLWEGASPYRAYVERLEPATPIRYLDGVTETGPVARPGLARTPANTAPLALLLAPLARLSWSSAWGIWFGISLVCLLAIPWLTTGLWPEGERDRVVAWLLFLVFLGLQGSRVALWTGQTTLLSLALMILALRLRARRPWLAGALLGVALSKYSLALPAALFFLLERRWRPLAAAALVQLAGLLAVSAIGGEPVLETARAYAGMVTRHAGLPGIHLGDLLGGAGIWPALAAAALTGAVALALWRRARRPLADPGAPGALSPAGWAVLAALSLWTVLVAYHRVYDTVLALPFLAAGLAAAWRPAAWGLDRAAGARLAWFLAAFVAALSLPGEVAGRFLPADWLPAWLALVDGAITISLLAALGVALWLARVAKGARDGS